MDLRSLSFNIGFKGSTAGIDKMNSATDKLKTKMTGVDSSTNKATSSVSKLNSNMSGATGAASGLTSGLVKVAAAVMGVVGAGKLLNISDQIANSTARINLMNDGLQSTKEVQADIFQAALDTHSEYFSMADAVGKLGITTGAAFSGTDEILKFVTQVNKQFAIGGTSAEGQSAAMLQLTQAMASGVLRGDELNSIYENAPTLIKSMADYMGVPVEQMRSLAEEGNITTDVIKNGVLGATEETNKKFQAMGLTFTKVWTDFKTKALQAFQPAMEKLNELANSQGFQNLMDNMLKGLAMLAPVLIMIVSGVVDFLNNPAFQTFASGFMNIIQQVSPMLLPLIGALGGAVMAIKAVTIAQAALNLVMSLNPVSIIILAIAGLVAALVYFYQTNETVRNSINMVWQQIQEFMGVAMAQITALWNAHGAEITAVASAVWGAISTFVESAMQIISGIITTVLAIITGDWEGAWNGMKSVVDGILNWFGSIGNAMFDIGANIINGIIEGIKSKVTGAVDSVKSIAKNMADAFKSFWGINSPATLGIEFGGYIPEGVAIGVDKKKGKVEQATSGLSTALAGNMKNKSSVSGGGSGNTITLSPTFQVTVGETANAKGIVSDIEKEFYKFMERYSKELELRNQPVYV